MSIADLHARSKDTVQSQTIDHLGLVAATAQDLNIAGRINEALKPADPQRVIDAGTAVVAMIINGLGFTSRQLYLTPQYFENKPVERLLGKGIEASMLTDHALGRALDDIADYGPTELFSTVAYQIALDHNLLGKLNHLDSTSLSVQGRYDEGEDEAPTLTYGHSKDHRPDLKQIVMSLVVNGPAQMPLWMEALDGNSSDKTSFHQTICKVNEFTSQLAVQTPCKWVADSALYNKKKLLSCDYLWLTRVPETINEAKALVQADAHTINWKTRENGYQTCSYPSHYGDCKQRWMLVYSQKAYERESATFEKKLIKQAGELDKTLRRLEKERFSCQSDAEKALDEINKSQRYFTVDAQIQLMRRYVSKGRPTENSETKVIGYQILTQVKRDESAIENALNSKGRFILATNDLDEKSYPDELMLKEYKEQQDVERGFRFLKDPWFMVDTIFLKSPRRIEALMMVMTLCLMVYNIAQYKLRTTLIEEEETLPNQKNKPIQNPTLRWVFQLMEGVCAVSIKSDQVEDSPTVHMTNITDTRKKIIQMMGNNACAIYGLIPERIK